MSNVNSFYSGICIKAGLLRALWNHGKLSPRKVSNFLRNRLAYCVCHQMASYRPSIVFVEPTNRCNVSCPGCRAMRDEMYDQRSGFLDLEVFRRLVPEIARDCLLVPLYWMGEPLLHQGLVEMVQLLTDHRLGSFIATNGMALTPEASGRLLDAGVDAVKVAVSGYSQAVYEQQHRKGKIERILEHLKAFSELRGRRPVFLMLDFLQFEHNQHEIDAARCFCRDHGIHFNIRKGYVRQENVEADQNLTSYAAASDRRCDWLWGMATVNWEGKVYPCCQISTVQHDLVLGDLHQQTWREILDGEAYRKLRRAHCQRLKKSIPACRDCYYEKIDFQ